MPNDLRELEGFSNAITDYMRSKKISMIDAMRFQSRKLIQKLIEFTPPEKKGRAAPPRRDIKLQGISMGSRFKAVDRKGQGSARLAKDIRYAVGQLAAQDFKNPYIQRLIREKRDKVLTILFSRFKGGKMKGVRVSRLSDAHKKQHTSSRGRRGRPKVSKFKVATTDDKGTNAYIRRVDKYIGRAKGGWAAALVHFGGSPAEWIKRHGSKGNQGTYLDKLDATKNPYLLLRNKSPWAGSRDSRDVVRRAIRSRTELIRRDIMNTQTRAILARLKKLKAV